MSSLFIFAGVAYLTIGFVVSEISWQRCKAYVPKKSANVIFVARLNAMLFWPPLAIAMIKDVMEGDRHG